MKIALVCPAFLPATQFGGLVFLVLNLARELSKLGNEVIIYTTDMDFSNTPTYFNKKLPQIEEFEKFTIKRTHVWFSIKLFFINPSVYFQLKHDKPDVIHTIGLRSFQSIMAWLVSKNEKIPLISSDQGGLTTHPDQDNFNFREKIMYGIQNFIIKKILNHTTIICAANEYEKEIFSDLNNSSKIKIVRNGINVESLVSDQDFRNKYDIFEKFILFVGRFSKSKGVDTLLEAFKLLKNNPRLEKILLVLMGVDFGFQEKMFKMIEQLGLKSKIKVITKPPREDVISAYGQSEFLILPSDFELSPLTPLESFAFKKPVISTNVHGIPYTVKHNENGLLVEPHNPTKLADAIIQLITNPELQKNLGNAGYQFVLDECNSKAMATNILNLYREATKDHPYK